jgi:hypothetical protein
MEKIGLEEKKDLVFFIGKLISIDEYWTANYYLRCMKKLPHGGVAIVDWPNFFLHDFRFEAFNLFVHDPKVIPYFLENLITIAIDLYNECEVEFEELLQYCFSADNWYAGMRLLQPRLEFMEANAFAPLIWTVIENKYRFQDYFTIDLKLAIYALIVHLVENKYTTISNIEEILDHEILATPNNKYGLTNTTNAEFLRQGFRIGDKYYLYNIFLDTSIGHPADTLPLTIRIIKNEPSPVEIFMRCDENLAIPFAHMICTATVDAQKYHGITVDFANIEALVYQKEVVVHIHPVTQHKILLTISPDVEKGQRFFHIGVEELWNPGTISGEIVTTNFIHAKYYPASNCFNHIDFSINQYSTSIFTAKYIEAVNETGVRVDRHGNCHYKIWCIEGEGISINTWSNLVCATLNEPFREIFLETFHQ